MASNTSSVWAIDIGSFSLKGMHLSFAGDTVEVLGFDVVQHSKILSGSGISDQEKEEIIAYSLNHFLEKNHVDTEPVVIAVPSQNSFARFVKLPPVEEKKIPEMVNYEATQQIPFDINEVQWDWQLMSEDTTQERNVGIFAIKNEIIDSLLDQFLHENLNVTCVQMSPMALYNYLQFDRPELCSSDKKATVMMNIGAETTDLVVCTKSGVWQRCIPMGGNAFTRAIADAFKLNFQKAEKLKRTAAVSKYARQILQAMKPVFSDLSSEIQRSLGFYSNSYPNVELTKIVALGGGTKMRGLVKYLQQSLQIPVEIPDSFKKPLVAEEVSDAKLHDQVRDLGIVYGLGVQVLGHGIIDTNLIPKNVEKTILWAKKTKYFYAAAIILLVVSLMSLVKVFMDGRGYENQRRVRSRISSIISEAEAAESKLEEQTRKGEEYSTMIDNAYNEFENRDIVPGLIEKVIQYLPNEKNNPEQAQLYRAFKTGDVDKILQIPRKDRKQLFVTNISVEFSPDVSSYSFGGASSLVEEFADDSRGFSGSSRRSSASSYRGSSRDDEEQSGGPGFIIKIAGYSPYANLEELLDPAGVQNDPERWGFVTRLANMTNVDPNSPFELFSKSSIQHFVLQTGIVGVDSSTNTPAGVGELVELDEDQSTGYRTSAIDSYLIDPMTEEVISRQPEIDALGNKKVDRRGQVIYEINDKWFVIGFKLLWSEAPEGVAESSSSRRSTSTDPYGPDFMF